jgi:DNA-binding MarR family transcriptional regulator
MAKYYLYELSNSIGDSNRAKLSKEEVVLLRETAFKLFQNNNLKISELASILNIDRHNISKVLKGVSWKELGGTVLGKDYG